MWKHACLALLVAGVCADHLAAQYPGQYPPVPPGSYPGGYPYPGGGMSIPRPSRSHKKNSQDQANQPKLSADGQTVSNDGKQLVVATADGRTLTLAITPQTKFTRSGSDIEATKVISRTTVHVEASEDDQANLSAVTVALMKDAPPEPSASGTAPHAGPNPAESHSGDEEDMTRPTILVDPNNVPDRPMLHHGKPNEPVDNVPLDSSSSSSRPKISTSSRPPVTTSPQKAVGPASESGDFTIDSDAPAPQVVAKSQELIDRSRNWAGTFMNGLPNFVCSQMTTRYVERSKSEGWQPVDVLTAKVVYEDGKEEYKEITVGGRRTNKSMLELGGSTSTGEFASILGGLMADPTRAEFKMYESTSVNGRPAAIYDFKVPLANSNWTINIGGQTLRPAYSGSVWIDKETAQVRRIEMQADNVPKDFPEDTIQSAVDYDQVMLGASNFLLPIHAENLACERGSPLCTKNTIDFRDYHKYSGESTITFK
jgi:hypothetical protein